MRALIALLALLAACGAPAPSAPAPAAVVEAFTAAGLAASNVTEAGPPDPVAEALSTCRGVRFDVEADRGARVLVCGEAAQAEQLVTYYTSLGENPMFFSHVHRDGPLVFQMNGQIPVETFAAYVEALP